MAIRAIEGPVFGGIQDGVVRRRLCADLLIPDS